MGENMKKFWIFLVDRFTGRNAKNFEVHDEIMTLPNMVTIAGIFLTVVYVVLFTAGIAMFFIPIIVVLVVLTDALDGYLADRLNQHSRYGKVLDPLRDRIFTFALLWNILLIVGGDAFLSIVLLIALELNLALYYRKFYLSTGKVLEVHWIGKARSALQWLVGFWILVQFYWLGTAYVSPFSLVSVMFMASFVVSLHVFRFRK